MNERGKSDERIVPGKLANKGPKGSAEPVEGRRSAKGNVKKATTSRTQNRKHDVSPGLTRIRKAAGKDRNAKFTTLLHHVTNELLRKSFKGLDPKAASGVDNMTWMEYQKDLEIRLTDLNDRVHRGAYRAKPTKRTYIPKADGKRRPLGIPALEDKIVQHALVQILNQIYETQFLGFSYGFRPGRSQHQALDAVTVGITKRKVNWVLDLDIQGFFDTIDHGWLLKFLEHRIKDRRVLRLISKWLKAGVSEEGRWSSTTVGTPQGAVISPLLANVFLHYVFDLWIQQWRWKQATGDMIIIRYADDVILGFQYYADATRCLSQLRDRFTKFGLQLHPEKTRLIEFGRFAASNRRTRGQGKPESFNFLGFTHSCGHTRNNRRFKIRRKTMKKRFQMKLQDIRIKLRTRINYHIDRQGKWLGAVVRGYFQYHAIPDNLRILERFKTEVARIWLRTLRRRSQRDRTTWARLTPKIRKWLPNPRVLHPYPAERLVVTT